MLGYPSGISLSSSTLQFLARHLRQRRREIGSQWRRLSARRQALLALAHLRCGDTYSQLAAAFHIGIATVYRYIREAVEVLSALAPSLEQAITTAAAKAFVILTAPCCRSTASPRTGPSTQAVSMGSAPLRPVVRLVLWLALGALCLVCRSSAGAVPATACPAHECLNRGLAPQSAVTVLTACSGPASAIRPSKPGKEPYDRARHTPSP